MLSTAPPSLHHLNKIQYIILENLEKRDTPPKVRRTLFMMCTSMYGMGLADGLRGHRSLQALMESLEWTVFLDQVDQLGPDRFMEESRRVLSISSLSAHLDSTFMPFWDWKSQEPSTPTSSGETSSTRD